MDRFVLIWIVWVALLLHFAAGEPKLPPQLVVYWGQNSNGAINPGDRSVWEKPLAKYCEDRVADVFVLSFLISFQPMVLNFAYHCETTFPGSSLLNCPDIGADIKACQKLGARVLLSLGGASGSYGFSSDSQGREFAHTLWQTFFVSPVSGSSGTAPLRPFGDAVLDGIDLDIEGGSTVGYVALVSELRTLFATDPSKRYLIAAAPQCPYPDALLQPVLNQAWVDLVMVQFYNNYCGVNHYPAQYNFQTWDTWARTVSINPNVSVLVGVPGGPAAAQSGFVAASTLQTIIADTRQRYPSFGGVMVWEASMAWATGFASQAMNLVKGATLPTRRSIPRRRDGPLAVAPPMISGSIDQGQLRVDFYAEALPADRYQLVVKLRTNTLVPLGPQWQIGFPVPSAVTTVDSTNRGQLSLSQGRLTVTGMPQDEPDNSMAVYFSLFGQWAANHTEPILPALDGVVGGNGL